MCRCSQSTTCARPEPATARPRRRTYVHHSSSCNARTSATRTSRSLPVSLDRLNLRASSDDRVKPAVSRAGRQVWVGAVTWIAAVRGGARVGCASHRSCGGSAVVRRPVGLSGHGARWRGAGRRGRGRRAGERVDGQRNCSHPTVRGRVFSCSWPVRVSRDAWVHGRMVDGGVPASRVAGYMCWSAGVWLGWEESGL